MGSNLTENEKRTLEECLRNLRTLKGCNAEFIDDRSEAGRQGALHLAGPWGELNYRVMTRLRLSAASAEVAINQLKETPEQSRSLLITDYLSEELSLKLRQSGVDYVDAAGNASLQHPPLYVEVSGRKRPERQPRSGRAFQTAGLKLIFLLLRLPQAVRWTYRDLALEAGIALGAVGPVLRELEDLGYLKNPGSERNLQKTRDLMLRWEIGYGERLRPALNPQSCRLADGQDINELPAMIEKNGLTQEVLIGGELGIRQLLQQGPATSASLHFKGDGLRTMLRLQLIPDPQGQIQMLERFGRTVHWQGWHPQGIELADPLLLHAELQTLDKGLPELRQHLFDRYLAPRISQQRVES